MSKENVAAMEVEESTIRMMDLISKRAQSRLLHGHSINITKAEGIPTIAYGFLFEVFNTVGEEAIEKMTDKEREIVFNFFDLINIGIREEGEYNLRPYVTLGSEAERLIAKHSNVTGSTVRAVVTNNKTLAEESVEDKLILNNILNKAIQTYDIDITQYREKFGSAVNYNNMVTALVNEQPLSIMMYKRWCDYLGLKPEFSIGM